MTVFRFFRNIGLVISFGVLATGIYFAYSLNSTLNKGCERIAEIARDVKAVSYLDSWAQENVIDKGYYFVSGMHGVIGASSIDGSINNLMAPEEEKSHIEPVYFRFGLEKIGGDFKDLITRENVGAIRFGRGRNSIILLKNGHTLKSHRGDDEASGHLMKINDSTFAYCSDARF